MANAKATIALLDQLTSLSKDTDAKGKKVTLVNGFQAAPELIQGYHSLVKQATLGYHEQANAENVKYTSQEQVSVNDAFAKFADALILSLSTTIGKHGILEAVGVAYQMAAVLRGVEGVADEIAFTLIGELADTAATSANEKKKSLDKALQQAIDTYANGLP